MRIEAQRLMKQAERDLLNAKKNIMSCMIVISPYPRSGRLRR